MKKTLICGAASFLTAVAPVASAFAVEPALTNGSGSAQQDVTVGEVDETIYSVDISWGDLTFDWKYDNTTNTYNFQPRMNCASGAVTNENSFAAYKNSFGLYTDNTCSTPVSSSDNFVSGTTYYYTVPADEIQIKDYTTNGRIKAIASYAAEDYYGFVSGDFGSWGISCSGDVCTREFNNLSEDNSFFYNSTQTDADGDYRLLLNDFLVSKNASNVSSESITSADKLGTITITITPDTN